MDASSTRPLAVVTGASSGIGLELAKQFAAHEFDLIVAAEDTRIEEVAGAIGATGVQAEGVQADLSSAGGVERLWQRIVATGRDVDSLALNAGIGAQGAFATEVSLIDALRVVDLNVRSVVHLAKLVLPEMVERGAGRVLFTSSIAASQPGTFHSVYNASKSFVQSFALGLREELADTGVTVTSLMPGPTDTEFFERAGMEDTKLGQGYKDDPREVARDGFEALMAGDERVVSASAKTKLQGRAARLVPDSAKAKLHGKLAR